MVSSISGKLGRLCGRGAALLLAALVLLAALPVAQARAEGETVAGLSPHNVKVNLFDYWLTQQNAADNAGSGAYNGDGWIHYNHVLFFSKVEEVGNNGDFPGYNKTDTGDTKGTPGMVQSRLGSDGYPVLNGLVNSYRNNGQASYESLAYLFDPAKDNRVEYWAADCTTNDAAIAQSKGRADGKASYTNVGGLLQYGTYQIPNGPKLDNAYYYDAHQNFAEFDQKANNGSFTLYNGPKVKSTAADQGVKPGQFFPFNRYSTLTDGTLCTDEILNHYFGMTMDIEFYMPEDGKIDGEDMIFYFSGDDDLWLFVDGYLVGDVGGLHSPAGVTVNFATKQSTYTGNGRSTLAFPQELASTLTPNSKHTLKMFYMERGNYDSNLAIAYNLYNPSADFALSKTVEGAAAEGDTFTFDVNVSLPPAAIPATATPSPMEPPIWKTEPSP